MMAEKLARLRELEIELEKREYVITLNGSDLGLIGATLLHVSTYTSGVATNKRLLDIRNKIVDQVNSQGV